MTGDGQPQFRQLIHRVFREREREPALTVNVLRSHWPGIVGPELVGRTWPARLRRGTLWIAAPDACWAYELQFFKRELLGSVRAFLESEAVRELRFQTGEVPQAAQAAAQAPEAEPTAPPPAGAPARLAEREADALSHAAGTIADPSLRQAFQRSLGKQRLNRSRRSTPQD